MTEGQLEALLEAKVHENHVRRLAARQELAVHKTGRRDPRALDYCCMYLIDPLRNVIMGPSGRPQPIA
jgi:hypothetical protein